MTSHKRESLAMIRKCIWPAPVYVGTFEDGSQCRMSFWSKEGKPLDIARGRRIVASTRAQDRMRWHFDQEEADRPLSHEEQQARARRYYEPAPRGWSLQPQAAARLVSGFVELQGERVEIDDMSEKPAAKPKAPPARKVAAVLADLLKYLDGQHDDDSVIGRAHELAKLAA